MSALEIRLQSWLEQAVLQQVLTRAQAWEIQDLLLQSDSEWTAMPPRLFPAVQRLQLWEMEVVAPPQ